MPTIRVARMLGKVRFRFVATIAALFVPYCPGGHTLTALCRRMRLSTLVLSSPAMPGCSGCCSSSMARDAAARLLPIANLLKPCATSSLEYSLPKYNYLGNKSCSEWTNRGELAFLGSLRRALEAVPLKPNAANTATLRAEDKALGGLSVNTPLLPRAPDPVAAISTTSHHHAQMAEPLGLIGVIGVAVQLIQLSTQLGLEWKDAPTEARTFILELQTLKTVLSETNTNAVLNQDFADAFHGRRSALLSELDPLHDTSTQALVSACQDELQTLVADIRKQAQGRRLGWERLRAAFFTSAKREAVENLRRRCSTLNELLQIDTAAIVASTHREVKEGRKEQQQQHQAQSRALDRIRERVDGQEDRQAKERAREEKERVLNWLDPTYWHAGEHNNLLRRRQPGTGQWLLESPEFKTWCVLASTSGFLCS